MMTIDQILTKLDHYYKEDQLTEVEPFILSCLEDAKKEQEYGIYISVGNELLGFYRSIGQFEAAFAVGEDVLLLMEELQLAELYSSISILLEKLNENENAALFLEKAIQIMEKQPGTRVEVATSRTSLALIELKMDKLEAAEKHLELAISAFKEDGGKTDTHYSAALAGLGEVCYRQGSLERSLENYEHALFEVEKHFGRKEGYGLLCGNCAAICRELGQSAKAEEYEVQRKKYCPEA